MAAFLEIVIIMQLVYIFPSNMETYYVKLHNTNQCNLMFQIELYIANVLYE